MAKLGNEIVTDLPLQMCLFFNCCYFPFWLIISVVIAYVKYDHLNYLYKFVLVTILIAATIIELVRLYLGYLGNLTEKVLIFSIYYEQFTRFSGTSIATKFRRPKSRR